ncbi:universal stress protein [Nesterenkonia sp. E16_7]|uniref:universal stress protein n=1 Tax=unclassified Nesterenkonia TaxID=2629769 RepID=UPI001A937C45|nr:MULTISPECIES: universal stress protein [unclassified Nesterenkonia]MBO0595501.1 universal stress protein [Nesterenkonia sp. E16_10]MBO0599053.1 universal stress protein [Nesterenkonia sp. E16_7]
MTVLVAGTDTAEGRAAYAFALQEAARRGEDLLYFGLGGERPAPGAAEAAGVREAYAEPDARGKDGVGDLLDTAERIDPSVIVIGIRQRTPASKFIMGSSAQQIILQANTPVLCVKPGQVDA